MMRPPLRRLAAALVLGAATTLGFAWIPTAITFDGVSAKPGHPPSNDRWHGAPGGMTVSRSEFTPFVRAVVTFEWEAMRVSTRVPSTVTMLEGEFPPPRWAPTPPTDTPTHTTTIGAGFPFVTFTMNRSQSMFQSSLGPLQPAKVVTLGSERCAIPLRPYWPGLIGSLLAWTLVFAALLFGLGAGRQRLRILRGRCIRCRYDLSGVARDESSGTVTCPECGRRVPARTRAAT